MDRGDFMLAAMSPAGTDPFSPVQVQKMFFLLDKNICAHVGGPYFDFAPYDYGPFDKTVYRHLEKLETETLVEINRPHSYGLTTYRLTSAGRQAGARLFQELQEGFRRYIEDVVHFVRTVSFAELVSSIYYMYPDMRVNSVFVEDAS